MHFLTHSMPKHMVSQNLCIDWKLLSKSWNFTANKSSWDFLLKNQLPWIITSQSPTQLNIFPSYIQKISNLTCLDFRFKISTEIPGAISSWLLFLILQYSAKIKKWVFNSEKQRRQHMLLVYEKIKTKFHVFHFPFHVVYL